MDLLKKYKLNNKKIAVEVQWRIVTKKIHKKNLKNNDK